MITFLLSVLALILGYFFYGRFAERVFGIDPKSTTPAYRLRDGVDYIPMNWGRIFLIQFLNIAGLGPIFGAIAGAMWGPIAFLWIVLGCIFAGAVHDYFSGMISLREDGKSISEIIGKYLGNWMKQFSRVFTVFLMILVGAVFVMGPAKILTGLTGDSVHINIWIAAVFLYYLLATLLPIDKLIGRIYPFFGFALLFMAVSIPVSMIYHGIRIPELTFSSFRNFHTDPGSFPAFPMMFITIACGAISGFHSTQSPLMARCIRNESLGRRVFYGAMITEGIVALIWAAVAMSFFGGIQELNGIMTEHQGNAAWVVDKISHSLLGKFGAVLAILGVVAAPITSGDTAFRSARLIVADFLNFKQKKLLNRFYIAIPLFATGFYLTLTDFSVIWRYMAFSNQSLATIVLWAISVYLYKNFRLFWIALIPAIIMSYVCVVYIMIAPEGFRQPHQVAYIVGGMFTALFTALFIIFPKRTLQSAMAV